MSEHIAVQRHLAKYCILVDSAEPIDIAKLFWDDARLEFGGEFTGGEAILACFEAWAREMRDPVEGLRHLLHMPHIEIDGEVARSVSRIAARFPSIISISPPPIAGRLPRF